MQKSRLYEIFTTLTKTEQRELGKFVRSPVFNQRQDVVDLYDYLYQNSPFKDERTVHRERVFAAIFSNEKFDAAKFDYTMSFLFTVVKDYLVHQEQEADPIGQGVLLTRALRKRNLGRIFEKELKTTEKNLDNQPFRDAEYHFHSFQLHLEKHSFAKQESRTSMTSFQEFSEALTHYFLAKKLWEACTLVTHRAVSKVEFEDGAVIAAVLQLVEHGSYRDTPAVNLYYHCYKALTEQDSLPWFEALRSLMRQHRVSLPPSEAKDLYLVAINYCIGRSNRGERAFLQEAFELYKEGLAAGAFLDNNTLSRFTYNNITMAGLLLKDFAWVENFLHEYRDFIEPKYRESTFNYNLAIFYFQKPDYERAMELLQQADFDDLNHNLSARRMLLRIYFEQNEREALSSLIPSFKNFIYRHRELGAVPKSSYLNLLRFSSRILAIDPNDKELIGALKKDVEATEQVAEKAWLLGFLAHD
ncbi:MAG: hypothetical protein GC192_07170 [Bacteroidetes bacterium]|nr:hypothetical protein [Bacteroidota bacterium]